MEHHPDEDRSRNGELRMADVLAPLAGKSRWVLRVTAVVILLVLVVGFAAYVLQPVRRSIAAGFRPEFEGIDEGTYPNGTPFSSADVVDSSVIDQVYADNGVADYCPVERFRSGFTVHQSSPELSFLDAEFQSRLADPRLTSVERQSLLTEYEQRRSSLPRQYEVRFIPAGDCADIPNELAGKALIDTLEIWARDSVHKRGVLRVRVAMLSPGFVMEAGRNVDNLLVRADMVRRAVRRVIQNIRDVERVPGSEVIRGSDKQVTFFEVRAELEDLVQARLDPLVLGAGRLVGGQAAGWVEQARRTSAIEYRAAEQRAEAYRAALREYSGVLASSSTTTESGGSSRGNGDVQALAPQIDRTFIDRIVEMSEVNTTFRQRITQNLIEASVAVVAHQAVMEQYEQLAAGVSGPSGDRSADEIAAALEQIRSEATDSTKRFNEIYALFSDVALRAGSSLYRLESPPSTTELRGFDFKTILLLTLAAALLTPALAMIFVLLAYHVRRPLSPPGTGKPTMLDSR